MIDLAVFAIVSLLGIGASMLMFVFRDILHSAIALASVFFLNSLLFLLLGQPLLAVIQLFILVGGIATFIFVGVASAPYSKFRYTRVVGLVVLFAILFSVIAFPLGGVAFTGQQSNLFTAQAVAGSLSGNIGIFYLILLTMFGVSLGAIVLLKKSGAKK